jgi:ANTAR domain
MPDLPAPTAVLDDLGVVGPVASALPDRGPSALRDRTLEVYLEVGEVRRPAATARRSSMEQRTAARTRLAVVGARLRELRQRLAAAETKAATLERGLISNRRIGMAVGILMCRDKLTEDQAFDVLRRHSMNRNVKVRDLAETVIYTGTL